MPTITIQPELFGMLEEIATFEQVSVDLLAEYILMNYAASRLIEPPSDEEIAAVKEAFEEAEKPDAVWYTQEEVEAEIFEMIKIISRKPDYDRKKTTIEYQS